MRILFLSRWFPYPANNGSKLRIYHLLAGLAKEHELTLLSFYEPDEPAPDESGLSKYCQQIETVPWKAYAPKSWRAVRGFFSTWPRSLLDTFSLDMVEKIQEALAQNSYDLVIASQVDMAIYANFMQGLPAIFEEAEVGILYEKYVLSKSPWERLRHGLTWMKHRRFLNSILRHYRACSVVSERERQLLASAGIDEEKIEVIPNCVDLQGYANIQETPVPRSLIFTGSFRYQPNYEAMVWFLEQVYERLQDKFPDVQLTITGDHAGLPLPTREGVHLSGYVDDIRPLVARSWCCVVPLQTGGGTRLKILEAMALGTPVVATSKGSEGLDVQNGVHLLLADDPVAYAEAVACILADAGLRERIVCKARQLVSAQYDWAGVMPRLLNLVRRASAVEL